MAYSTNRYFKPAVYTPMVTEVEAPFKELFAAGRERQAAKDAAAVPIKTPEGVDILPGVFSPDGTFIPNAHADVYNQIQNKVQTGASTISSMVANGNTTTQEQQGIMNAVSNEASKLYGDNGLLKKQADATKNYKTGSEIIAKIPDIQLHPWSALAWDRNIRAFANGETDYIDPAAAMQATYIDRNEEINKIMQSIQQEGTAYAGPNSGYLIHGTNTYITKDKIDKTFQAGFQNSKLMADMLLEKQYNIEHGMSVTDAETKFQKQYEAAQTMAEKYIMSGATAGISVDPITGDFYKQAAADKLGENKTTVSTKNPKAQSSEWQTRVLDNIIKGQIKSNDPQYNAMLSIAKRYLTPDQVKSMNSIEIMTAYNNALKHTQDRHIEYLKWTSPTTMAKRKELVVGDLENRTVAMIGEDGALIDMSDKKYNANMMATKFGLTFPTIQELLKSSNVVGIQKTDQHDLGAGSTVATVWSPVLHRQLQFIVSPDMDAEKTYEASTWLNEPLVDPSIKNSYYILRPSTDGKHAIDFSSGTKVDKGDQPTDSKYGYVPMYIKSESYIINPGEGDEQLGVTYRTMVRQSDGSYKEDKNLKLDPQSLFSAEDNYYVNTHNIPNMQNKP